MKKLISLAVVCMMAAVNVASADTIRGINMEFVTIGNAGNAADTQVMNDGTTGYGVVGYNYRIGKYEVTNAQWNAFTAAAGAPTGNPTYAYDASTYFTGPQQPTNNVSWYEAAQFCNYLTSGNKSFGAYQLGTDGSITINRAAALSAYGTAYVIPTENEWYKAAYFKPNGSGYSLYANGQSTIPSADNGWNYTGGAYSSPWNVGTGTLEQNGTKDMMGNVWEWNETLISSSSRGLCGGSYGYAGYNLASSYRSRSGPGNELNSFGFRVASIPEPCTLLLLGLGGLLIRKNRS
jgi:sulfatase modifying factor 1